MVQVQMNTGLSPERIEQIRDAQKRHVNIDPGCVNLTPDEIVKWHPIGGISWEERARRMEEAGIVNPEKTPAVIVKQKIRAAS